MSESLCEVQAPVAPSDRLYVPHRKRLSKSYAINDDGIRELRIDYGIKEVSFDEERLFPFGEQLVSQPSFIAESATGWGPGYPWEEIQPLLDALLSEGIIKRGDGGDERASGGLAPSPLPPSSCPMARTWSAADCEAITAELGQRPVEVGFLEAVVPVYRVAHSALDGDDRQVGEANVFPPALRLDRETEWRVCQYPGSRYQDDSPMNITALKAMIKHWKPMMAALLDVRAALAERLGIAPGQKWTIGDLHTLAVAVLALPAYSMMKGGGRSPQPPLHPVLSSLFRITDGVRMTTYEMQFLLSEKPRCAGEEMTAAEMFQYAEQHGVFISPTGVCAGPKPLIDEFLLTAVDGVTPEGTAGLTQAPEVAALLAELPAALDYGMRGLQIWGLSQATWLVMSQAYRELLGELERAVARSEAGERLVARLRTDWLRLDRTQIAKDFDREVHLRAYADAHARARRALQQPGGSGAADGMAGATGEGALAALLQPGREQPAHREAAAAMQRALLGAGLDEAAAARAAAGLVRYMQQEQSILAEVAALEEQINQRLQRPRPTRSLTVRDFRLFYVMSGGTMPYLFDALESELGVQVEVTSEGPRVTDAVVATTERRAS